jgi:ribosomal protein S18 acetylase RimI-like enzyme
MPIRVRDAGPADAGDLVRFNRAMAEETEGRELPVATVERGVSAVFDRPGHAFYLVAETDGEVVGSLMVTTEWSDWRCGFFWWIQSVYVRPAYRRRGVYRRLHEAVRERAIGAGACGCRLYVERENRAAQAVYRALGMSETAYRLYEEDFS